MNLRFLPLAAALALIGSAHAQTANVTLYGLLDAAVQTSNGVGTAAAPGRFTRVISGGIQGSRYGFKGEENLGDGLKAVFVLENQIQLDTGANKSASQAFSRKAEMGLAGGFGRVTVGRHTTFSYDTQGDLDPIQFANFTPLGNSGDAPVAKFFNFQVVDARRDNSVKYQYSADGVNVGLMYAFGEDVSGLSAKSSLGARAGYTDKQFSVHVSYDQTKDAASNKADGLTLGGTVTADQFTFYAGTVQVKNNFKAKDGWGQKNTIWWLGTRYAASEQLSLHAGWFSQKQSDSRTDAGAVATARDGKADTLSLMADYTLSKRTDVYAAYQRTSLKDGLVAAVSPSTVSSSVNTMLVGVRTKF